MLNKFKTYRKQVNETALKDYLVSVATPVWESDLMRVALPRVNMISSGALELYRWHFVLFNALYQLSDEFGAIGMHLFVHFMKTSLQPFPPVGFCRFFNEDTSCFCASSIEDDSIYCPFHEEQRAKLSLGQVSDKYFYGDMANFNALTKDSAEKFIAGAWNLLQNQDDQIRCWKIIGLPINSDIKLVKRRFRQLAQRCHPDLYPDRAQQFVKINSAYRRIVSSMIQFG